MSFEIPYDVRDKHVYVPGATGSGKSTLLYWMAIQDIDQGKGVCVIDPKGDLAIKLLNRIPRHRVDDVIYMDHERPLSLDFMGWETAPEKDRLADDLSVMFKRFFMNTTGDRWQSILSWTINTLLAAKGCTFLDIYYLLADPAKRQTILERVTIPEIRQYWQNQYPFLPKDAAVPITTRMSKFILTPSLRAMLGNPKPNLNLHDMIHHAPRRPVMLVNLSEFGEETKMLLGTLIVSKIQQAAMRNLPISQRRPFYLYTDEFQNFQTNAFETILSQARGFKLCLTLAHQYVGQLDPAIRDAVLGNVRTLVLFCLDERDALYFRGKLPKPPDPDASEKYREGLKSESEKLAIQLRILKEQREEWSKHHFFFEECPIDAEIDKVTGDHAQAIHDLLHLPKQPTKEYPTAEMIPRLPVGKAIYRAANGDADIITTPKPPGRATASYAENILKRNPPCNPPHIPHDEGDGGKDQEPTPTGKPPKKPKAAGA